MKASIKRPLTGSLPYFSDDDLQQLANWVMSNLKEGKALELKSVLSDDSEILVALIK